MVTEAETLKEATLRKGARLAGHSIPLLTPGRFKVENLPEAFFAPSPYTYMPDPTPALPQSLNLPCILVWHWGILIYLSYPYLPLIQFP